MAQMHPLGRSLAGHARGASSPTHLRGVPDQRPDVATDLYSYATQRGFHFPRETITRYLLALASRRFAMFTGVSGTGKTKLALLAAEYYAQHPGTQARRWERPSDSDHEFYLKLDKVTLRSGTLTPTREQLDYFNVAADTSETFTATITNILGAHGDITFRATNYVAGGRRNLSIQVPSSVRRAFEQTGVTERDYLRFEIVEEFKRYRVSVFRPASELIDVPAQERYAFVSVRPSWTDHTALLGAWDPVLERYVRTPVLELLLRAAREEHDALAEGSTPAPYFIILDEMNLARIEHYFSDFLSALESRRLDADGSVRQETIPLHGADAARPTWMDRHGVEFVIPERIAIPTNVVFTGTLNLDETTHGVSPKVIDRTHVLSFNSVDFAGFLRGSTASEERDPLELTQERTRTMQLGRFRLPSADDSREVASHIAPLVELNELLVEHDQHFGYRMLNDVGLFVRDALALVEDTPEVGHAALDAAVLQKVIPKFYGWTHDRGGLVASLLSWCADGRARADVDVDELLARIDVDHADRAISSSGEAIVLPRSAGRLVRMLRAIG